MGTPATIITKYLGPTNVKGSRIKAISNTGKSVIIERDYALNSDENHNLAAMTLAKKIRKERADTSPVSYVRGWHDGIAGGYIYIAMDMPTVSP